MDVQISYRKSPRNGFEAKSRIPLDCIGLPASKVLHIDTGKRSRGGVHSCALVSEHGADGIVTFAMFSDYFKEIYRDDGRCTESNVKRAHQHALAELPATLEAVKAHYAQPEPTTLTTSVLDALTAAPASSAPV